MTVGQLTICPTWFSERLSHCRVSEKPFTNTPLTTERVGRAINQRFAFWQMLNNSDLLEQPLVIRFVVSLLRELGRTTHVLKNSSHVHRSYDFIKI